MTTSPDTLSKLRRWANTQALFDIPEAGLVLALLDRLSVAEAVVEAARPNQFGGICFSRFESALAAFDAAKATQGDGE